MEVLEEEDVEVDLLGVEGGEVEEFGEDEFFGEDVGGGGGGVGYLAVEVGEGSAEEDVENLREPIPFQIVTP